MRKRMIIALLVLITSFYTLYSKDYFIGSWGNYENMAKIILGLDSVTAANITADYMQGANINHIMNCNHNEIFLDHGINPITSGLIRFYSRFNDCTFEAEYRQNYMPDNYPPVSSIDYENPRELAWYRIIDNFGTPTNPVPPVIAGNSQDQEYYIVCNPTNPLTFEGYVVDILMATHDDYNGDRNELYPQITLIRDDLNSRSDSDLHTEYYRLKYRMRINTFAYLRAEEVICKLGVKVKFKDNGFVQLPLTNITSSIFPYDQNDTFLYSEDNNLLDISKLAWESYTPDPLGDWIEFEYLLMTSAIEDYETTAKDFLVRNGSAQIYLMPVIYFCDTDEDYNLDIDNVSVTDDLMVQLLDDNSTIYADIVAECQNVTPGVNLFAGIDEPLPAQFKCHKRLKEILQDNDCDVLHSINNMGATLAYQDNSGEIHLISNLLHLFAESNQVITQSYPSRVFNNWSELPDETAVERYSMKFFQGKLSYMLETYKEEKLFCQDYNLTHPQQPVDFYPIIQCYGEIRQYDNGWKWERLLPPAETQKALCYLPLCFGADGIFYYTLHNFGNETHLKDNGSYEFYIQGPVYNLSDSNPRDWHVLEQYNVIAEANEEIAVIGSFIKTLDDWDSEKNFTLTSEPSLMVSSLGACQITAFDGSGINGEGNYLEGYDGYVECTAYSDVITDYFMLVNRRANFPLNDYIREDDYTFEDGITVSNLLERLDTSSSSNLTNVDDYFAPADSQTVLFEFDYNSSFPEDYVLQNIYTGDHWDISIDTELESIKCEVNIGPGEGMLLKLGERVRSAP